MEVLVLPTAADVARRAAEVVIAGLGAARRAAPRPERRPERRPEPVIGLATGSSPLGLYAELAAAVRAGRLDLGRARGFALDEYVGLPAGHPQSYREVLLREVCGTAGAAARPPARAGRLRPRRGRARRRCSGVRATHRRRRAVSTCRSSASGPTAISASTSRARRCRRGPGSSGCRTGPGTTTPASSTGSTTCRPTASPRGSAPFSTRGGSSSSRPGRARRRPSRLRSRVRCRPRARPRCSSGTPTRPPCSTRPRPSGLRNRDYYDASAAGL